MNLDPTCDFCQGTKKANADDEEYWTWSDVACLECGRRRGEHGAEHPHNGVGFLCDGFAEVPPVAVEIIVADLLMIAEDTQ